ncbi:hypothetical protein [Lactobacillus sp. HT06-2]|uniref:hypothetical protein n=1 Tax=Lactobacillus sp. HT06-2 TaxID=2080222 RepID=UPI000CD93878|nr:hypothetical protein [Lactobacillus sp. HT06-2]
MTQELKQFEEEFINKSKEMTEKYEKIKDDPEYQFNLKKTAYTNILDFASIGEGMVEHNEKLDLLIVPVWAANTEIFDTRNENSIAQTQFENYFADRMETKPANMWQTPLKLVYSYVYYDYQIGSMGKLENYSNQFLSYEAALVKYQDYRKTYEKIMKMINKNKIDR